AERDGSEVETGVNAAERIDGRPFEVASCELVERIELEGAGPHSARAGRRSEQEQKRDRSGERGRSHEGVASLSEHGADANAHVVFALEEAMKGDGGAFE